MRPALKQLLQAEAKGKATLEQGLSKEDLELLRNTFDANMTDVMAVAKETSPDAEALAEQTKDAAYLYAVSLTAAGRSPHNAAKLAVNKFIKDHTTYTDTFAIPNDYDAGAVEAYTKAELAKHEGDLDAFAWRNTDDGTGLKLVTPDGEPILDSDGKPIRKTFEEMQREGQALPEDRQGPSGLDEEITDNAVRATSVDVDGLSDYGEDEPNPSAPEPSGDSDDASEYGGASTKGQQDPSDIDEDVSNPGAAGEGNVDENTFLMATDIAFVDPIELPEGMAISEAGLGIVVKSLWRLGKQYLPLIFGKADRIQRMDLAKSRVMTLSADRNIDKLELSPEDFGSDATAGDAASMYAEMSANGEPHRRRPQPPQRSQVSRQQIHQRPHHLYGHIRHPQRLRCRGAAGLYKGRTGQVRRRLGRLRLAQHRRRHRPEARHPGWRTH
ncbi:MAG: hypothetical protein HN834_21745, partial [Rhodospirillaceae bacterium]|nr:hypothetical protein [Rhodospirillaceae bacterium]